MNKYSRGCGTLKWNRIDFWIRWSLGIIIKGLAIRSVIIANTSAILISSAKI